MTMESGHYEVPQSSADRVRSPTFSSSPELWREILERLREVQESQTKLADAIEVLGMMVQDALGEETSDMLDMADMPGQEDLYERHESVPAFSPSPPPTPHDNIDLSWEPAPQPPPELPPQPRPHLVGDAPLIFKDSAPPADSDITSVEASAQRARSGAAEVQEPAVETGVPEPVFYVPSFDEEVLPATSVAELSASALDAVLASEFGPGPSGGPTVPRPDDVANPHAPDGVSPTPHADTRPSQGPAFEPMVPETGASRVPPSMEHNRVLDILLGTPRAAADAQSHIDAHTRSSSTASNNMPPLPVAPSPQSTIVMASPPPPPPPPPPPVVTEPTLTPPPPPVVVESMTPLAPVFDASPNGFAPPTEALSPPTFVTEPTLAAPPPPPPPPPPVLAPPAPVAQDAAFGSSLTDVPTANLAALSAMPTEQGFDLRSDGSNPLSVFDDGDTEPVFTTDPLHHADSAASMATEILSASPDIPTVAVPEELEAELISKDVTLIARGRKKRFRLH